MYKYNRYANARHAGGRSWRTSKRSYCISDTYSYYNYYIDPEIRLCSCIRSMHLTRFCTFLSAD